MQTLDFSPYSMKHIAGLGLPIYIHGANRGHIQRLLDYLSAFQLPCAGLFDEKAPTHPHSYADIFTLCEGLGIPVQAPPADAATLPHGVVICAADLCEMAQLTAHYATGGAHTVYNAHDLFCYTAWVKCQQHFADGDNLLLRCRSCPASYRSCPLRARYYGEKRGAVRERAVTRLLVRCGFICNFSCEGCSQFIPYFTPQHKSHFDGGEVIADLRKAAGALQYIDDLWLEGGEALLWKPFPELLDAAAALDNLGRIFVLTNGSYVPGGAVLDALERHRDRIQVQVNAYEANPNLSRLFDAFDQRKIPFILRNEIGAWTDFRDTHFRGRSAEELQNIKRVCSFFKRDYDQWMLTDGKLSAFCCEGGYITHFLDIYDQCAQDFIDLRQTPAQELPRAMAALYARGTLSACNYCAGGFQGAAALKVAQQR